MTSVHRQTGHLLTLQCQQQGIQLLAVALFAHESAAFGVHVPADLDVDLLLLLRLAGRGWQRAARWCR